LRAQRPHPSRSTRTTLSIECDAQADREGEPRQDEQKVLDAFERRIAELTVALVADAKAEGTDVTVRQS
jgi:hypothetical protein